MVGDHDGCVARPADRALNKANAKMRAGGIDAFTAPIRDLAQRHRRGEKGGKAGARQVAVGARCDPARHQRQSDAARTGRQRGSFGRFLEIQKAEIIFPSLAHHRLFGALGGIGIEPRDLLHDLALQVAGVGGNPQARSVLLRPQRGRRQIGQGLAGSGAGLHQRHAGRAGIRARAEGIGGGFAIGRLFRARRSHQSHQARLRFLRLDWLRTGRAHRRFIFPLRQRAPSFQPGDGRTVWRGCPDLLL